MKPSQTQANPAGRRNLRTGLTLLLVAAAFVLSVFYKYGAFN